MTNSLTTAVRALRVDVDGRRLPGAVAARLASLRVSHRLGQPAQCELALVVEPGSAAEHRTFPIGAALAVGAQGESGELFTGEVTAFELDYSADGAALLRVRGYDSLHRLRKQRRAHVFEELTVAQLARRLVEQPVLADDEGPQLERVFHHYRHDFELLVQVAQQAGLFPVSDGDVLRLVTLRGYGVPAPLELGGSLLQVRVEANADQVADGVSALGWHPQRAELIEQRAGQARSGRQVPLRPDPADVGGAAERVLVERSGRSDDEVRAAAQAALDAMVATAVTVHGVADGSAALRAGGRIALSGVAAAFCGTHVLTEVVHTVDADGYLSRFSTEPPRPAPPSRAASLTLGVVREVDDPQALGRVRVSLPAYGDLDAGWLGVLCAGAGAGRGLVALPDVDDTVLVALPHGEPVSGVVLGGLFGGVGPPDAGVQGGRVRRWSVRTGDGQWLVLDDEAGRLRLGNRAGSFVELAPDLMRVHAATDLVLQAPGKAITIRGKTVDFVRADATEEVPDGMDH